MESFDRTAKLKELEGLIRVDMACRRPETPLRSLALGNSSLPTVHGAMGRVLNPIKAHSVLMKAAKDLDL